MDKNFIYNKFYKLMNGEIDQILYSKGYSDFDEVYEELKEEGQLIKLEEDKNTTKIISEYPSLLRKIKQGKEVK